MTSPLSVESSGVQVSRLRIWLAVAALALLLAVPGTTSAAPVNAYRGLGTWVDIYDPGAFAAPERAVAQMAARGVRTLYLETGNYKSKAALVRPDRLARFVEAAHAAGIRVVAWYLPSLANLERDFKRSLAAIEFRTPNGERFDSFALDIEAAVVRSPQRRNARLLTLSRRLRQAAGADYPLGAIIPSPRGMELTPSYWPGFPYAELASIYDVFLPMVYFTYRVEGGPATRRYVERSLQIIRTETGDPNVPIHVIGGVGDRTSAAEARAFMRAVAACAPIGYSIYDFTVTREATWRALLQPPATPASSSCAAQRR